MKTNTIRRKSRTTACALALTGSILGSAAFAQVDLNVNIDFNAGTGMYTYTHAVLNKGQTFDLAIVNLNVATTSNLMNLSAPTGFGISYDAGVGIASFYEDADPATPQTFAPNSTTAPFTFTSTLAPVAIGIDALDANGNAFTGFTLSAAPDSSAVNDAVVTGILSGNFTLTKSTAGNLTLTGANTYTGGTVLNAGTLFIGNASALGTGNLTVNGGTLRVAGGPLVVNLGSGNITFNGGTYLANVGGTIPGVTHDQLTTTGMANISGGTLALVRQNNFLLTPGAKVVLLSAAGGVAGGSANGTAVPASNVTVLSAFSENVLLVPVVSLYTDRVTLETRQGSFAALGGTLGLTPNQLSVARGLDSVAARIGQQTGVIAELNYLDTQSLDTLRANLDRISPEELTSIFNIAVSLANIQSTNIQRRLEDIRSEAGNGAGGSALGGISSGANGPVGNRGKQIAPAPDERWGVFFTGSGEFTRVGSTSNAAGFNLESGGVTAGVDYRFTDHFAAGISLGYMNTTASLANGGKVDVDGGRVGAYATYFDGGLHLDAAVSGGPNSYSTRRSTPNNTVAAGSPDGSEVNVLFAAGYDWKFGALTIGPTASFQYTNVELDGFTETGGFAPLNIIRKNAESTRSALGVRATFDAKVGRAILRPEVRASWQHEYGDSTYSLTSTFATLGGNPFTVSGPTVGRDSLLVGGGLSVLWNERLSTYVYYDGELLRQNYSSHNISAGIRYRF